MCREGSLRHTGRFINFPLFQIETPELKQSSSAKARFGTLEEVVTGNWDRQRKGNPRGFQSCWARNMEKVQTGRDEQMWYFQELVRIFRAAGSNRIVEELGRVVEELNRVTA